MPGETPSVGLPPPPGMESRAAEISSKRNEKTAASTRPAEQRRQGFTSEQMKYAFPEKPPGKLPPPPMTAENVLGESLMGAMKDSPTGSLSSGRRISLNASSSGHLERVQELNRNNLESDKKREAIDPDVEADAGRLRDPFTQPNADWLEGETDDIRDLRESLQETDSQDRDILDSYLEGSAEDIGYSKPEIEETLGRTLGRARALIDVRDRKAGNTDGAQALKFLAVDHLRGQPKNLIGQARVDDLVSALTSAVVNAAQAGADLPKLFIETAKTAGWLPQRELHRATGKAAARAVFEQQDRTKRFGSLERLAPYK